MAKKKYICTGCHKCTEPCTVELSGDADMTKDPTKLMQCGTWVEVPAEEDTNKEQRPKLTADVFSFRDCPEWAQFAAVDAEGVAYWYDAKPKLGSQAWCNASEHSNARQITLATIPIRYDSANWKNSLIERRRKLTAEIFNHPECPADAVVAVVNASGTAAWGNCADIVCDKGLGAFLAVPSGANNWTPIPGGACFDATDWQHSAVYRDIVDNTTEIETLKLTHDVFSCSTLNEWKYVIRSQVEHGKTYARCPEWARYAAVDQSGAVCVYDIKPVLRSTDWYPDSGGRCAVVCNADKCALSFDTTDWKNSLIERPESECMPKLTPDVFSYSTLNARQYVMCSCEEYDRTYTGCPDWARYAAVNKSGEAYVYENKPVPRYTVWTDSGGRYARVLGADKQELKFDGTDWKNSLIERPSEEQLPKLTQDVFDRLDCPSWARYAAVDADGMAYWYEDEPIRSDREYKSMGTSQCICISAFDASDWEHSLIERPSVVPKLTHEVFSMPECPEWARYAAVDSDGVAFWYEEQPKLSTLRCWFSTGLHSRKINHPGRNVSIVFDGTDWAYSLIERPTAAPKLTADVFSMKACPEWARYAAVDANGFGYWYVEKPEFMCNRRGWIGASVRNIAVPITREGTRVLYDATDWEHSLIERPAAAPKLTHDVFSMEECPKWARFTAVDADGVAYWYEVPPRLYTASSRRWESNGLRTKRLCHPGSSMSILFDADGWKNSLIERQPAEPRQKLTTEVFSMPECPEWARYAAVDASGLAYWYDDVPRWSTNGLRWQSTGTRAMKICYAGEVAVPLFDATDWQHSLIERPAAVPEWFKPGALACNMYTHTCFHVTYSTEYCENYLEAKVRPFSADELARKLGQFVIGPNNSRLLVTGYCAEGCLSGKPEICVLGDKWLTAEELLTYGSRPQGIKQYHSKEGTWIDCGLSS